jgi:ubiquitin-protein ligase
MEQPKSNESIIISQAQMISIINKINEDISQNIPQTNKEFHIYTKYNQDNFVFKIFVKLNLTINETEQQNKNIFHFLIIITQNYPKQPPVLHCISHVYIY